MMVETLELKRALLCYTSSTPYGGAVHYWQIHPVTTDSKGVPHLEAGRSVSRIVLEALCKDVVPSLVARLGWVDLSLLAYGSGVNGPLVFFRPSIRRPIYFGHGTGLKSGIVPWPSMIMLAEPSRLFVYVVKGNRRPGLDAELFCPPFMNVYPDQSVCIGETKTPSGCRPCDIEAWAESFYNSAFTHPNGNDQDFLIKGTLEAFWHALLTGKRRRFPYNLVKPVGKTLRQLLIERNLYEPKRPSSSETSSDRHGPAV
ncbi:MAG: PRTRC system protein B [Nitrospiria bacterium]